MLSVTCFLVIVIGHPTFGLCPVFHSRVVKGIPCLYWIAAWFISECCTFLYCVAYVFIIIIVFVRYKGRWAFRVLGTTPRLRDYVIGLSRSRLKPGLLLETVALVHVPYALAVRKSRLNGSTKSDREDFNFQHNPMKGDILNTCSLQNGRNPY